MDFNSRAGGGEQSSIKVECPFQLRIDKQSGIEARWAKEILGDLGLGDELVPEVHRKLLVAAAEHCDQVVLEGSDRPFCCVAPVDVGGGQMEVHVVRCDVFLQCLRGFIVETLQPGAECL